LRTLQLELTRRPSAIRAVPGTLASYEREQRELREAGLQSAARAAGLAEAQSTSAQAIERAASELDAARAGLADSLAETAAALAVQMLQELLRVELVAQNYDIVEIVRSTIREAGNSPGAMIIHVHPEDAAALADTPLRTGTQVQPDPTIRRGDVHVQTPQGLLVRELDECVASIRERILAEVTSC
jgi:flagellar biosynthesis/type III secretory pathway protein FliH